MNNIDNLLQNLTDNPNQLNGLLQNLLNKPTSLILPDELPSDLELVHISKRAIKAVLSKETLSSADAPLLEALVSVVCTFQEN